MKRELHFEVVPFAEFLNPEIAYIAIEPHPLGKQAEELKLALAHGAFPDPPAYFAPPYVLVGNLVMGGIPLRILPELVAFLDFFSRKMQCFINTVETSDVPFFRVFARLVYELDNLLTRRAVIKIAKFTHGFIVVAVRIGQQRSDEI